MIVDALRACPPLLQNQAKGPPGSAREGARASSGAHQPWQAHGQILPGLQPEGADVSERKKFKKIQFFK
ncbi:hypothetical protein Pyn_15358 [Prunus yedoensis var. nudiflora]|uniref:Uncharacterized protein n=1 Tax=Prunus yedoensis var. nudiflora TaxID=2094558 RepID=A0A314ZZI2_PRUYE|nr:hypothetical protein Pyn_15358 [Prunus yedoensis var. nudiflora]